MMALWLSSLAGRLSVGAGLVVVLLSAYGCEVSKQRKIGEEREKSRVEKQGSKVDAKATKARRAAERNAPDSLREYVRD